MLPKVLDDLVSPGRHRVRGGGGGEGGGQMLPFRARAQSFQKKFLDSLAKFLSQVLVVFYIGIRDICICEHNSRL